MKNRYVHGHGVRRDLKRAFDFFRMAAERGSADAQYNIGAMHVDGLHLKKAYEKALHYLTLSAHQGHTLALHTLAKMHVHGLGTPRSCLLGAQFLKAVAERGEWGMQLEEAHAMLQAGMRSAALQVYAMLAVGGFELAQSNAAFLLDHQYRYARHAPIMGVRGEELARRAMGLYAVATQQGNVDAEIKLGDYFYFGHGTPVDLKAAVGHYRAACDQRSAQAMFNLAYMYAHGLGLSKDYHLAKRHYDMALESYGEAWVAVNIALFELELLQVRDSQTGSRFSSVYSFLTDCVPARERTSMFFEWLGTSAPHAALLQQLQVDSIIIFVLVVIVGCIIFMRQQRRR